MPTNQLMPFANGDTANVIDFTTWNTLPQRISGFGSGIARSDWFNRILAQGGSAGYVLGQFVVDYAGRDADINAENLYQGFLAALQKLQDTLAPCGMIAFFHTTDVPDGWLLCNGALVSRTEYARLFAKIGTKYGAGDGSTTFALPNLDGRVLQGTTDTGNVGNYLEASLPNMTGYHNQLISGKPVQKIGVFSKSYQDSFLFSFNTGGEYAATALNFEASDSNSIYSGTLMQPKSLQVLACIRI